MAMSAYHGLAIDPETLRAEALEWATTRGSRSGRVAWQFTQDLAGRLGKQLGIDAATEVRTARITPCHIAN